MCAISSGTKYANVQDTVLSSRELVRCGQIILCATCSSASTALSRLYKFAQMLTRFSESVYRHFGPRTLQTQDTSDLPNFRPKTLQHVRSVPTLQHWCQSVFCTLRHYTCGVG